MRTGRRLAVTRAVLAGILAAAAAALPAHAVVRSVPLDYPTIQAAIDASVTGDSIAVAPGTYVESLTLAGKDVTLYGIAGTPVVTTNHTARVLDIGAGVTAATEIVGLALQDGLANQGGGIRCSGGASARIRQCAVQGNRVYQAGGESLGGGVFVGPGSSLLIEDCSFLSNFAREFPDGFLASGGAIYCASGASLTVRRSLFYRNGAQGFEGGPGGAIACLQADATLEDCTFDANGGGEGGAISSQGGLVVEGCVFRSSMSAYGSAAIAWSGQKGIALRLRRSVFYDNMTAFGSTVFAYGDGEISHCTLAFNQVSGPGAALWLEGNLDVHHNIVANNEGYGIENYSGPLPISCNDVWGNLGANYGPNFGDRTGILDNISEDPLFCDAAERNFRLLPASPCAPGASACDLRGALGTGCAVPGDVPERPASLGRIAFLEPVTPNPARDRIDFRIEFAQPAHARLTIVDAAGRLCATVADGPFAAGRHERTWRATNRMSPGVYWAVLDAGTRQARRFVILP